MIENIFENLTQWRNLPNYQLERRADIFFSLYLSDIIEFKTGINDIWHFIPEFPVAIKVISEKINGQQTVNNKSYKIDYLAIGENSNKVIFLELKTDNSSRQKKQDWYLQAAKEAGLGNLLKGLIDIFVATKSREKYYHLFLMLKNIGLLNFDPMLETKIRERQTATEVEAEINKIEVMVNEKSGMKPEILYIQPEGTATNIVNFENVAEVILKKYNDPVSIEFAKALTHWSKTKAGDL